MLHLLPRFGRTHIHKTEVAQIPNERAPGSAERKTEAPEHPLKSADGQDSQRLVDHGKSRLPSCHSSVKKTDAGNDKKNEHAHDDLVDVFEFDALVGQVDVDGGRVTTLLVICIPFWEHGISVRHTYAM